MKKSSVMGAAVAGGALLLAGLALYLAITSDPADQIAPPDVLVDMALNGKTLEEREQATVDLARSTNPEAIAGLRRVLAESRYPEIQACAIQGLGFKKDIDSMPSFLKIVKEESQPNLVRGRASLAILKILGDIDFGWDVMKEQTPDQVEKLELMTDMGRMMWELKIPPR